MTSTLITHLDKLVHLSPDEIVKQLRGWMRPSQMTREYWGANQNVPHVYWFQDFSDTDRKIVGGVRSNWYFRHCNTNMAVFMRTLDNSQHLYWLIPLENFSEDNPPPCPPT